MSNVNGAVKSKDETQGAQRLFDASTLGASFQHLAVDVVRGESTDFVSRWFRSTVDDADLVIWTDSEKRIVKHQLCFYGQVVEWNPISGTRTGLVIEEEFVNPDNDLSETIRFDARVELPVVSQAIEVLAAVPEINDTERSTMIFNFRESPKLHKRARDRAIKAWAPKIEEITSATRPKFWKRLRSWVLGD